MINRKISAVWSTIKQIAPFCFSPSVQEVHTKTEVVHLTPGLLGLGVLFNCHAWEMYCEIILESLQFGVRPNRLNQSLVLHVYKKYMPKLRPYTLPLAPRLRGII